MRGPTLAKQPARYILEFKPSAFAQASNNFVRACATQNAAVMPSLCSAWWPEKSSLTSVPANAPDTR